MRAFLLWLGAGAALAGTLVTSTAFAQTPAAPTDNVTVVGKRPTKPCSENDNGCILAIAKEAWAHYPDQVRTFCDRSIIRKEAEKMLMEDIIGGGAMPSAGAGAQEAVHEIPPALKKVCDYKPAAQAYDRSVQTWTPWARVPSAADIAAAYPRAAAGLAEGDAKIYCNIDPKGRLYFCTLSQESPDRKDFGPAALKLSHKFLVKVDPAHPRPASANWIDISIHFTNPSAPAASTPAEPALIVHPDWIALPDGGQSASMFPAAARQAGVQTGVGRVDCQIGDDGALGACKVVGEEPAGLGFGDAALAAAPAMRANLWSRDGLRTPGAHVVAPLRFNADEAQKSGS